MSEIKKTMSDVVFSTSDMEKIISDLFQTLTTRRVTNRYDKCLLYGYCFVPQCVICFCNVCGLVKIHTVA